MPTVSHGPPRQATAAPTAASTAAIHRSIHRDREAQSSSIDAREHLEAANALLDVLVGEYAEAADEDERAHPEEHAAVVDALAAACDGADAPPRAGGDEGVFVERAPAREDA